MASSLDPTFCSVHFYVLLYFVITNHVGPLSLLRLLGWLS